MLEVVRWTDWMCVCVCVQGRMIACGRYDQLVNSGLNIAMLLKQKSVEERPRAGSLRQQSVRRSSHAAVESGGQLNKRELAARQYSSGTEPPLNTTQSFIDSASVKPDAADALQLMTQPLLSRSLTLLAHTDTQLEESILFSRVRSQLVLPLNRMQSLERGSSVWSLGSNLDFEVCNTA